MEGVVLRSQVLGMGWMPRKKNFLRYRLDRYEVDSALL